MKRPISIVAVTLAAIVVCAPAHANNTPRETRFRNVEPLEPLPKSRSDAAEIAANVPGAAAVLLEALRWRGRTAKQIGLPAQLWCADFMNFILRRSGGTGTHSRAMYRKGPNNGHVGIVRGTDGKGNPIIVSGNSGNQVRISTYPKERVLGYVMPPDYVLQSIADAARADASSALNARP
jgi:hypothetical protein